MSDSELDRLGPVDFVIVEFPADQANFSGEVLDELANLIEAGTIRLIDAIVLLKDDQGDVDAMELSELDDLGPLASAVDELAEFLAEEDIEHLAAAMDPGSVAGILVYENLWAAPFAAAARRAGGQLIADGRIHTQAIAAAIAADDELERQGV